MSFDGSKYIRQVGRRLVQEFQFSTEAGHSTLIGTAKEHPARTQLEKLLPSQFGVGSGLVVDSYGNTSLQQDIVIFERLCPRFTVNDTPEATYFPVEGVVATGEVKSVLKKGEIENSVAKSQSVKSLTRYAEESSDALGLPPSVSFRNYGQTLSFSGTKEEEFSQSSKSLCQVYTFVLCERFGQSDESTLDHFINFYRAFKIEYSPNIVVSLNDGYIIPHSSGKNSTTRAPFEADGLILCGDSNDAFVQLMRMIRIYLRSGKTVDYSAYERYFSNSGEQGQIAVKARRAFQ